MELIIFILISYGASNIMVYSSMFEKWRAVFNKVSPRFFGELFQCMICLPFWWGVIVSLLVYSPTAELGVNNVVLTMFFDACLASGSVWLLHTLQEKMENRND